MQDEDDASEEEGTYSVLQASSFIGPLTHLPRDRKFSESVFHMLFTEGDVKQKNEQRWLLACKLSYHQLFKMHFPFQLLVTVLLFLNISKSRNYI